MKQRIKKSLALLIIFVMLFSLMGTGVFADPSTDSTLATVLTQAIADDALHTGAGADTAKEVTLSVANGIATVAESDVATTTASATVAFYGTDANFATPEAGPVSLTAGGDTDVYIKVTAEDTATVLFYKVTINRAAASEDASLSTVLTKTVADDAVHAGYNAATAKEAAISVLYETAEVSASDVVATTTGSATVYFYGIDTTFTAPEAGDVDLAEGASTVVYIKVVAEDGTTALFYKISISRAKSDATIVAEAKAAVDAACYTNLIVAGTTNQSQKTTAVQAVVNNAVLGMEVTATTTFNTPNYDVAIVKSAASASTSITNASFTTSGAGGGGGGSVATVSGKIAVVGKDGELLFGPNSFSVSEDGTFKLTVLGALDACGAGYQTGYWEKWGYYVSSVCGLPGSGSSGWMYAVNGTPGAVMAGKCPVAKGDLIVFYYASSMDALPPSWSDLVKLQDEKNSLGGGSGVAEQAVTVKADDLSAAIASAKDSGVIALKAGGKDMALSFSSEQMNGILKSGKLLSLTIQEVEFSFNPAGLELKELLKKTDSVLSLKLEKLSDWELQNKVDPFSGRLKLAGDIYEFKLVMTSADKKSTLIESVPDCTIVVPVPQGLRENAQAGVIMAYWFNEADSKWELMGGVYDEKTGTISFKTNHFSKYALLEAVGSFNDVDDHWAAKEINIMAANGLIKGMTEGEFQPDTQITRAQFVSLIARIADLKAPEKDAGKFTDIPADSWCHDAVEAAVENGIVSGVGNNRFAPDQTITREEMAVILSKVLKCKNISSTETVSDQEALLKAFNDRVEISCWAAESVIEVVQNKLMLGRDGGFFVPRGNASRGEAAAVLYKIMIKLL